MTLQQRQDAMRRRLTHQSPSPHNTHESGHGSGIVQPQPPEKPTYTKGATDVITGAPHARLLDLKAAGIYLGISYWTMRDLVFAGHIPIVKLPCARAGDGRTIRRVLVDIRDLDSFIEKNKEVVQ